MRTRNPNLGRSRDATLGLTSPGRSGSRGITVRDGTTDAHPVVEVTFRGASITDNEDGSVIVEFDESSLLNQDLFEDHGNLGATETLDIGNATWHRGTLNANCSITVTGFEAGDGVVAVVEIDQNGIGGFAITWDPDITFFGEDQPVQTAAAQSTYVLWSSSGSSEIYGARVGAGAAVEDLTTSQTDTEVVLVPDGTGGVTWAANVSGQHILLADGHATPFAFNDLLQMDDGTDFMWND